MKGLMATLTNTKVVLFYLIHFRNYFDIVIIEKKSVMVFRDIQKVYQNYREILLNSQENIFA